MNHTLHSESVPESLMLWQPAGRGHSDRLGAHFVRSGSLESAEIYARVRDEAARVLAQCLPPDAACGHRTGLLLGYAQSSKMLSMTTVSALARDNGFKIVIALTGTNEGLFKPSRDRFERDLTATASAREPPWILWSNPSLHRDGMSLPGLLRAWRSERSGKETVGPLFVSAMLHPVQLDHLASLLEKHDLGDAGILVLDDEPDRVNASGQPLPPDQGTMHQRLRDCLPRHTYLKYTAIAQGPLLITLLDMLSPDFVDVLESGDDYCGGRAFFLERSDLVRPIPEEERLDAVVEPAPAAPASLLQALRLFLVGVVAERHSRSGAERRSMLVHPCGRSDLHAAFAQWIRDALLRWKALLERSSDDAERRGLVADLAAAHADLAESSQGLPPLDLLLPQLENELACVVVTEASSPKDEVRWSDGFTHVVIGGERFACGLAFQGLTVSYLPRVRGAFASDTLQLRDRFFGYRRRRLALCRAFVQHDLETLYRGQARHEEHLREQVIGHRGRSPRDLRRALILDPSCQPRPRGPATSRATPKLPTRGWFKQGMPHVASSLEVNARRIEGFLAKRLLGRHPRHAHRTGSASVGEVIELLSNYAFGSDELHQAQLFLEQLVKIRAARPDASVAVLLMQPDPRARRTRSATDDSIELFEPRSQQDGSDDPGDAAMRDATRITLQIHWVRVTRVVDGLEVLAGARVPALAIHIPPSL